MTKAQARAIANKLYFEKYVGDRCEICDARHSLQVHHYFPKGFAPNLIYEKENAITLCQFCHEKILLNKDKIIKKRGKKWIDELTKKAYQGNIYNTGTKSYYLEKIKELQNND